MSKLTCLCSFLIVLLASCKQNGNNHILAKLTSDSLFKDTIIPYREDSIIYSNQKKQLLLQNFGRIMGLPLLTGGSENLSVRIWVWDAEKQYVINIGRDKSGGHCNIIQFNTENDSGKVFLIIHKQWKIFNPRSGWEKLFDTIGKYNVVKMKGNKMFKHIKQMLTRMAYIQFEISQPNCYRFYEHLEPAFYRNTDQESKNVYEFLKYLNNELGVQVYNPYERDFAEP